jgi:hypothetical protein
VEYPTARPPHGTADQNLKISAFIDKQISRPWPIFPGSAGAIIEITGAGQGLEAIRIAAVRQCRGGRIAANAGMGRAGGLDHGYAAVLEGTAVRFHNRSASGLLQGLEKLVADDEFAELR